MDYKIKLAAFQGPFDLLLHLIDKNKIDLYDIPMAELTQQYMDYVNESQKFNVEMTADFLVMAAKLLQIKSKMLLPTTTANLDEDETNIADDPRDELVQLLLIYQKFQHISAILSSMVSAEEKFVKRQPMKLSRKILPPQNLSIQKLVRAFLTATASDDASIPQVLVSPENFNVNDKMSDILIKLEQQNELQFSDCVETKTINECVTSFLALLELIKRHKVKAQQLIPFSEIIIKKFD